VTRSKLIAGLLLIAVLAVPALAHGGRNTIEVDAKLTGKAEVPDPGSKDGKGDITIFLKPTRDKVCFNLEVKGLDTITDSHIHKGAKGVAGDVKVPLFVGKELDGTGSYEGCVKNVKSKLIKKIAAHPERYYANVHTEEFPAGAIRGQLTPPAA